jgi:hypothetical protein
MKARLTAGILTNIQIVVACRESRWTPARVDANAAKSGIVPVCW